MGIEPLQLKFGLALTKDELTHYVLQKAKIENISCVLQSVAAAGGMETSDCKFISKHLASIKADTQLPAHRAVTDLKERQDLLESQGIKVQTSGDGIASVLSMTARLPPFDFVTHQGHKYIRLRGKEFIVLTNSKDKSAGKFIVVPTDDEKINLLIIPKKAVTSNSSNYENLQELVQHLEMDSATKVTDLWIPSFKLTSSYNRT